MFALLRETSVSRYSRSCRCQSLQNLVSKIDGFFPRERQQPLTVLSQVSTRQAHQEAACVWLPLCWHRRSFGRQTNSATSRHMPGRIFLPPAATTADKYSRG